MPQSTSFWEHPIDKLEQALSIRRQIAALQDKLGSLFGGESEKPAAAKITRKRKGKRTMSPEARERIAAAQRARWAKSRGAKSVAKPATAVKARSGAKPKRTISPEARAKMAAAAKRRWAKVKKGA
jgi:hypothetical protein